MKKDSKLDSSSELDSEQKTWSVRIQASKFKMSIRSFHKKVFRYRYKETQADVSNIPLEEYLADWIDSIHESRSRRTIQLYTGAIQKQINPLIGSLDLSQLQSAGLS